MSDPDGWRLRVLTAMRVTARGCAAAVLTVAVAAARIAARLPRRQLPGQQRLCHLLVRVARVANPLVPSDAMTADGVARTIVQSRTALAVVLGTASAAVTTLDAYALAADLALGPAAVQWLRRHGAADAALAAEVHRTLADPVMSGPARLDAALRLVPVVAASLSRAQASTVWRFCLARASQPTDPYNPIPLVQQSREAAVELLIQRSELDSEIAAALPAPMGPRLPVAAELLAAALRRRPPDGGRALAEVIMAWHPTHPGCSAGIRYGCGWDRRADRRAGSRAVLGRRCGTAGVSHGPDGDRRAGWPGRGRWRRLVYGYASLGRCHRKPRRGRSGRGARRCRDG